MKKYYILLVGAILAATIQTQAQTKIGGSGAPDSSAMLEVTGGTSNNKGILLPRISLANVSAWGLNGSTPVAGMFVYNTNASVTGGSGVGTYYWDGTQWVKSTSTSTSGWNLAGNVGTTPATNFLGTTDNQSLVMRTNALERVRIDSLGRIGINDATPRAPLSMGSAQGSKIRLYDNNTDTLVYGFSISNASLNYIVENTDLAAHRFWSGGNNDNGTELMRIQGNGNVGIATASPQQTLHVQGTARVTGSSGTPINIAGRNAAGDIGNVTIGTGLSLTGGTLSATVSSSGWALDGNTGTNPVINYLGTTDAQPLVLRTNATEKMRVTSTGNVGIGTATPGAKLQVTGNNQVNMTVENTGGTSGDYAALNTRINSTTGTPIGTIMFAQSLAGETNGGVGVIRTSTAHDLALGTNNAERMRIALGGNVGIGTSAPTAKLDVNGTANIAGNVGIGTTTPGARLHVAGTDQVNLIVENTSGTTAGDYAGVNTKINSTTGIPIATMMFAQSLPGETNGGVGVIRTSTPHDLVLEANNTEFMRINTFGNVGIGTSAPTAKLDVNGTARIQGGAGTPTAITGRDAAGNINNITLGANLSLAGGVLSASGGTSGWALGGNGGTDPNVNYVGTSDAQPLLLRTNGAEHLRITTDGKIGINNAVPVASLDVNGSARISTSLGTPTAITGRDADGYLSNITLGANLSLAGGVLSASGGGTSGWGLTGNGGTNPAVNFIGTTDGQPLWFRTSNANQMVLSPAGFLGMNTANPEARLDISSNADDGSDDILIHRYAPTNQGAPRVSFISQSGTEAAPGNITNLRVLNAITMKGRVGGSIQLLNSIRSIYTGNGTTLLSEFRFLTSGQLGMIINDQQFVGIGSITPTQRLHVDGNVLAASYLTSSDRRLKTNISDMQNGLSTVMALRPVSYDKKKNISDHNYDRHEIGFIAQEVQKVLPSIVTENKDADKTLAVSYTELIPVLTKAIQELNTQVETLKAENSQLKESKAVTAQLMERVKQMEQMMGIKEIEGTSKVAGN